MRTRVRMIRNLVEATVSMLICGTALGQTTTNGLVGYWPMDNTQTTEISDYTTNLNHGAFSNGSPSWVAGKLGNALSLQQATVDYATIPHHASYTASNAYSIAFWLNVNVSLYRKNAFTKGNVQIGHTAGGNDILLLRFGDTYNLSTGLSRVNSGWHHYIFVYDPAAGMAAKTVYVDGTLIFSTNTVGVTDTALNTNPIELSKTSGTSFSGYFDDLAIWDRALTTAEIAYLYNAGDGNIASPVNPAPQAAPDNVGATASDESVILSWDANTVDPDAASYSVYRALGAGGPYTRVASNITTTGHTDSSLANGTTYHYVIRTVDLRGAESANSSEVSATPFVDETPPAAPTGLAAQAGNTRVYLAWSANVEPDFAGYNIYVAAAAGGPFVLTQALVTATSWVHQGLVNDVASHYLIRAEDVVANESSSSAVVTATPVLYHDTNPGLVGYWPLDETSGTNLVDASGTGNNGYFMAGTPTWGMAGKLGTALALDSADSDQAAIPHHASYIATDTFSISFWFQSLSGYRTSGQFNKGANLQMGAVNSDARWANFGEPWTSTSLGFNYGDGGWHHLVVTFEPSVTYGKRVYVDSALVASNTADAGSADLALNTWPIGLSAVSGDACTNRFDEIAIWDLALSVDQVESLYNGGTGRVAYTPPPSGTVIVVR